MSMLEDELKLLPDIRIALMPALGDEPVFHVIDGERWLFWGVRLGVYFERNRAKHH